MGATVASLTQAGANSGNVTVSVPSGTAAGDLLVAIEFSDSDGSFAAMTAPSGWTEVYSSSSVATTAGFGKVFTKTATGSEGSSYVFPSGGSSTNAVEVLRITGANVPSPFSAAAAVFSYHSAAAVTSMIAPSVTLAVAGQLLCGFLELAATNTTVVTQPSGLVGTSFRSPNDFLCMLVAGSNPGAGATGTKTATSTDVGASGGLGYLTVSMAIADAVVKTMDASQTETVTQTATATRSRVAASTQTETISQSALAVPTRVAAATQPLTLSQTATFTSIHFPIATASQTLTASQTASAMLAQSAAAAQVFSVSQSADCTLMKIWYFTTPTWHEHRRIGGRLWQRTYLNTGHTIIRFGTSYIQADHPSTEQMESADALYIGGRTYAISEAEAQLLTGAGYGHWVTDSIGEQIPDDVDFSQYGTGIYGSGPYGE